MNSIIQYYLRHEGGVSGLGDNGIGPIYSTPPFLQRGHAIG